MNAPVLGHEVGRVNHKALRQEQEKSDAPAVNDSAAQMSFRASRQTTALPITVRLLDQAGTSVEDVTARRRSTPLRRRCARQSSGKAPIERSLFAPKVCLLVRK